jgi:hypothetical protein
LFLAEAALLSRPLVSAGWVDFGRAAAHIDMAGRTDAQPDALVIHGENGNFDIVGEFDRLPNLPAQD